MTPHEVAYAAHRVETEMLALERIQDQLCASGVSHRDVQPPYATVSSIQAPNLNLVELRMALVLARGKAPVIGGAEQATGGLKRVAGTRRLMLKQDL